MCAPVAPTSSMLSSTAFVPSVHSVYNTVATLQGGGGGGGWKKRTERINH